MLMMVMMMIVMSCDVDCNGDGKDNDAYDFQFAPQVELSIRQEIKFLVDQRILPLRRPFPLHEFRVSRLPIVWPHNLCMDAEIF